MEVADSMIDALAVDYVSFGILALINNFWTWLAVVTAAISFWRIRMASGGGAVSVAVASDGPAGRQALAAVSQPEKEAHSPEAAVEEPILPAKEALLSDDDGVITKGKFTWHFDSCSGEWATASEGRGIDGGETAPCEWDGGEWWDRWERVVRLRSGEGDGGWYRHQDLTAINGNIVRLWDGYGGLRVSCVVW